MEKWRLSKVCIPCPASLTCMAGVITTPNRCNRCGCSEAVIHERGVGYGGIFRVEYGCPRLQWRDRTRNYYCVECAAEVDKNNLEPDGNYMSRSTNIDWGPKR